MLTRKDHTVFRRGLERRLVRVHAEADGVNPEDGSRALLHFGHEAGLVAGDPGEQMLQRHRVE